MGMFSSPQTILQAGTKMTSSVQRAHLAGGRGKQVLKRLQETY